jgi:putative heme iron utilization protein
LWPRGEQLRIVGGTQAYNTIWERIVAETGGVSGGDVALEARRLLRAARSGTLATVVAGQPFASLVTPACLPDLSIVLFLSQLSEHTRHLQAEPRCALMVQGEAAGVNPQMTPRVTVIGRAERCDDAAAKARWLALHPYAALYAAFTDFGLWRIVPEGASMIGGFARAHRLGAAALLPDDAAVRAVAAAEAALLAECNDPDGTMLSDASALDGLARHAGLIGAGWRMVALDCDGCDLARGDVVWRCAWPAPVVDAAGVRHALVLLMEQLRT